MGSLRRLRHTGLLCALALLAAGACAPARGSMDAPDIDPETARFAMVSQIIAEAFEARRWTGREELSERVLEAFGAVERHRFVPEELAPYAYLNQPLPVGHGQTVSQPFIVALMTEFAAVAPGDRVLLVGLGGGYQAAILAALGAEVQAVDLQSPVAAAAMARLAEAGFAGQVTAGVGDGYYGAAEQGPYDAIIVRQAVDHLPEPLLAQLKPGGRLVIPKGPPDGPQVLTLVQRAEASGSAGDWRERSVLPVRFTTMPGGTRL